MGLCQPLQIFNSAVLTQATHHTHYRNTKRGITVSCRYKSWVECTDGAQRLLSHSDPPTSTRFPKHLLASCYETVAGG
jgi:hypothetical protein